MMQRHLTRLAWSDETLVEAVRKLNGTKGSLTTIKRYKDGTATTSPTLLTLGLISRALGFSDEERNWVLEGTTANPPGLPSAKDQVDQWQQLLDYLNRQSNLPFEVQQRREAAKAALASEDYRRAKTELTEVANVLGHSAAYHAEEYARALAALGALALTEADYLEARLQYSFAIAIRPLPAERLERYRHSYVVASTACMATAHIEAEARAILKEMTENGVTPDVVSYSTLLNFVNSEEEARAILKEMTENGVTPNVVSYNSLLNFVNSEEEARAILKEMTENGVTPNEITVVAAIKTTVAFGAALGLIDLCLNNGYFAGRGAFEAAYSKPIAHLSAEELLAQYHGRKYKFDTALEGPINQYRRARREDQALLLTVVAPHVGAAQKLYREKYDLCRAFFEAQITSGNDEDNLYYAFGIAAALNGDQKNAKKYLTIALDRSYAEKRSDHIKRLLSEAPVR